MSFSPVGRSIAQISPLVAVVSQALPDALNKQASCAQTDTSETRHHRSFNRLVGGGDNRLRHLQTKGPVGFPIDHSFKFMAAGLNAKRLEIWLAAPISPLRRAGSATVARLHS